MEFSEIKDKFAPILKQYWIPILLGVFGLIFLSVGLIASLNNKPQKQDILSEGVSDQNATHSASLAHVNQIAIDVEGAVINPGVYKLDRDARVQDVLIAAGGLSDKADRGKVAKALNLASKIVDGGKIYVPAVGEVTSVADSSGSSQSSSAVAGDSTSSLININSATEQELDSLPGVGSVTAGKIINGRPYGSTDELLSKKVVGQSVFGKIKDKISAY